MATKYIVSATPTNPADTEYARKEYAVREAERRANQENRTLVVTVITSAGNQVHETEVIEPKPATGRGGRRDAVTDSAVEGYEVLYEKPAIGAELLRRKADTPAEAPGSQYVLYCLTHEFTRNLDNMIHERELRREGKWCPACVAHEGPTTKTFGRKVNA